MCLCNAKDANAALGEAIAIYKTRKHGSRPMRAKGVCGIFTIAFESCAMEGLPDLAC